MVYAPVLDRGEGEGADINTDARIFLLLMIVLLEITYFKRGHSNFHTCNRVGHACGYFHEPHLVKNLMLPPNQVESDPKHA